MIEPITRKEFIAQAAKIRNSISLDTEKENFEAFCNKLIYKGKFTTCEYIGEKFKKFNKGISVVERPTKSKTIKYLCPDAKDYIVKAKILEE